MLLGVDNIIEWNDTLQEEDGNLQAVNDMKEQNRGLRETDEDWDKHELISRISRKYTKKLSEKKMALGK